MQHIQCNTVNPTTVDTTTRMIRQFIFGPAKLLSITCISPRLIRHFTTVNPTTRMIRHLLDGPKCIFTTVNPTFPHKKKRIMKECELIRSGLSSLFHFCFVFVGRVFIIISDGYFSKNTEKY